MVGTLNELVHLSNTRFGRPRPRHGLKLLYWFASECVSFENHSMLSECDPAEGDFGFHYFQNRYNQYGNKLLPDEDFPYYVVGNLNSPGAEDLPDYVSKDKYTEEHDSNTDRIIVSLDEECFHRVYVTRHHDRSNYNPDATYWISRGLLMIIRRMSLCAFLVEMGYYSYIQYVPPMPVINYRLQTTNTVSSDFTAVTLSSSEPAHNEPPAAQNNDTIIQLDDDTPAQEPLPKKKGFCERFCTIL
ncbi:uncharacterized protein LOC107662729 [Sinocyclocheilus anshuiensis]|uniref:uncharacterized protein LOC107662729 n=1 Tax=Sinocyclocheilus anshuiensis TaxID=1608454 RepID=UPI0007B88CCA|nr:PREDICTED: uncharacterized protein LOC107662729 [Sinocyclocheilus anshuiensis]